ncbi:glycosyltransferase family 4 protein [Sphingobium cloacae]|uniref:Lipopolysaccharide core biosynthesis mannosyltransferase LpcC n=1 Tax=Sphingobium cloacae TaxID=120107 RepID=A0A1E1F543_9SPHN|nr:glycosyltransferase family 4 protein [Sphingobium cloacae]BAV65636.1 lipopolysaccharide core biosynthesis mannosyltransferase LpcC [Sphingobium cloacae]
MLQLSSASDALSQPSVPARGAARCATPVRICFPFGGGAVGGSHISATQLIRRLDRSRFSPLIVLHHGEGQFGTFLRAEGLEHVVLPDAGFFGNSCGVPPPKGVAGAVADQWRLARFLREQQVGIVHTNEGAMHVSWALPARLAGARLLWHHRGSSDARGVRFLAPFAAHRIVGVSDYALSEVRRSKSAARKTAVVYSPFDVDAQPIDRDQAHRALTSELGVGPDTRLIGFFGHMLERKRPLFFVDVLSCMARMRPDLRFMGLIFGSPLVPGMDVQVLHKARTLGVAPRLRLMGFRYPGAPLMAGCDIHAVPAVHEPFGRSLIEAMLLGTPVVAAASGGNIEAIDHGVTGLLSHADDPAEMASAIIGLLDSPDRLAAIAAAAWADATRRYSADRHVEQISAIYQSLLPGGMSGPPW